MNDHFTLLVVDDEKQHRNLLTELLQDDYRIILAKNGTQALELAHEHAPDLILLDILMPGLSGFDVIRALKSNDVTRTTPVIFITALDGVADEEMGLELGAVDYIAKPFRPPIVRVRVRNHLQAVHPVSYTHLDVYKRQALAQTAEAPEARPGEVRLALTVCDTGMGIAADQLDALFTPFTQVDESITRRFGGSGLGLAICRQLTEMMGGRISLESTVGPVSYTHLDVYKRQGHSLCQRAKVQTGCHLALSQALYHHAAGADHRRHKQWPQGRQRARPAGDTGLHTHQSSPGLAPVARRSGHALAGPVQPF